MNSSFSMDEFIKPPAEENSEATDSAVSGDGQEAAIDEVDVQKAVVESLAADKAAQDEKIAAQSAEIEEKDGKIAALLAEIEKKDAEKAAFEGKIGSLKARIAELEAKVEPLKSKLAEQNEALGKVGDVLAKNMEGVLSSKITLLERETDLPDRFDGETRDHVLEVIKEARDAAEADGRHRRAQLLEGVLVANEPSGNLAKRRMEIEKLFKDNGNIVSGAVMAELDKNGIAYKNGEEYLLPSEIVKRVY